MSQVVFTNGHTYSDDSDPTTGLKNGGARTLFIPLCSDVVTEAALATAASAAAQAAALTAVNAPGTTATSTTSLTLTNSLSRVFTIQAGKTIINGMYFRAASDAAPATNWMSGFVTGYSGTTLTILMDTKGSGAGTFADWSLHIAATTSGSVASTRTINPGGLVTGGGDLSADRTLTVTAATAANVATGTSTTTAITPAGLTAASTPATLTDAATISTFAAASTYTAELIIAGTGRTFPNPTGVVKGQFYTITITDDGAGARTITTWGSNIKGLTTLTTAAGKVYILTLYCYSSSGLCAASIAGPF